jgi:thioredoxin reductase
MNENTDRIDVLVVGGGAAGLSAGVTLARARRRVLVVDEGRPRNAPAGHVHNYLGHEGVPPLELLRRGRAELASYGGSVRKAAVVDVRGTAGLFTATLGDGSTVSARRLLAATGLVDRLPEIQGIAQRWGRDVLHCPYCHGWEVRDRAIGVVAGSFMPTHQAQLFRQLSEDVTLFRQGQTLTDEELAGLEARGIRIVDEAVVSLETRDDRITAAVLADGTAVRLEALVVPPRFEARGSIPARLGAEVTELPFGTQVTVDPTGATTVPGVYAAGNVSDAGAQVGGAAAQGVRVAAVINMDLVAEEVADAVAARDAYRSDAEKVSQAR